ncbi:MAG: HEPN domain-containing protein [Candidatus Nanohaloarchaea archaeon]
MSQEKEFMAAAESKVSVAKILLEEDAYDDAISRAYYGMYNAARALLFAKDSKPKTHEGAASELGKLYREEMGPEMTREFSKIQNDRLEADYEPSNNFTKSEAEKTVRTAEQFVSKAGSLLE